MKKLRLTLSEDGKISLMKYGLSLIATLAVGAVMILLQGENPATAFVEIFRGAFGSKAAIGNTPALGGALHAGGLGGAGRL